MMNKMRRQSVAQTQAAEALHATADVSARREYWDLDDVAKFQTSMPDYRIVVYQLEPSLTPWTCWPENTPLPKSSIYLWLADRHFQTITSMSGFFGTRGFCSVCLKPYSHSHACGTYSCPECRQPHCSNTAKIVGAPKLHCDDCKRNFATQACHDDHLAEHDKKSDCEMRVMCTFCELVVPRRKEARVDHNCMKMYCHTCNSSQEGWHKCNIQSGVKDTPTDVNLDESDGLLDDDDDKSEEKVN